MKILYIAQSCDPYNGSEDAIGWNIPLQSSIDGNDVYVITRTEKKSIIDKWKMENENQYNKIPKFYYIDINKTIIKFAKGPLYSFRLYDFNIKAVKVMKEIDNTFGLDIIHQITPIEFRSILNFNGINNAKTFVGPIAGAQKISKSLRKYNRNKFMEYARELVNNAFISSNKFKKNFKCIDRVIFANKETKNIFKQKGYDVDYCNVIPEIGVNTNQNKLITALKNDTTTFIMSGRMVSIKGYDITLDALHYLKKHNFKIYLYGDGKQCSHLKKRIKREKLQDLVKIKGFIHYDEMLRKFAEADALIFPSLREATGSVVVESMIQGVPVITFNQFGANEIVNMDNGYIIDANQDIESCLKNLANYMDEIIENRISASEKGIKAQKDILHYTWGNKLRYYYTLYEEALSQKKI